VNGSIVTPTHHLSLPTVTPTGVATENGFVDAPELVRMMQHALSLLRSSDPAQGKILHHFQQTHFPMQQLPLQKIFKPSP
jgi:hypothetical protein